jgi:hypothetical protein
MGKIRAEIEQMKSGKAPGTDNVIPEVLKVDTETSVIFTHSLKRYVQEEEAQRNGKKV